MIRIALTALKGGAGVTTLVSGLAQVASIEKLEVLCIDADDQGTLAYHLGNIEGLAIEGRSHAALGIRIARPEKAIEHAVDVTFIDVPRTQSTTRSELLSQADAVVLVVPASAVSVTMAPAIRSFLGDADNRFIVLNNDDARIPLKRASADYIESLFGERVIGRIRQDESFDEAVANLEPVSTSAPHSAAWSDLRATLPVLLERMEMLSTGLSKTA